MLGLTERLIAVYLSDKYETTTRLESKQELTSGLASSKGAKVNKLHNLIICGFTFSAYFKDRYDVAVILVISCNSSGQKRIITKILKDTFNYLLLSLKILRNGHETSS